MARRDDGYRYQGYRGDKGKSSTFLKVLIVLLAAVLLAGVVFVLFFMGEYMEYTENGPQFRPPWVGESSPAPVIPSDPVVVDDPVVVVTDPAATASVPAFLPAPEPIRAVEITPEQLAGGQTVQMAADAQANAVVVEMKAASGALAWQSKTELAAVLQANAADSSVSDAVSALAADGGLYLIARVQCFRDQALSRSGASPLLDTSGEPWADGDGVGWVSPVSGAAGDYLAALCRELADMGFDEIVLDSSGFPDSGSLDTLTRDGNRPEDLSTPVAAFYAKVEAALAPTDALLSVRTDEDVVRGGNLNSGVTAALLARYARRVWLPAPQWDDTDYAALLTAAGMGDAQARIVLPDGAGWKS